MQEFWSVTEMVTNPNKRGVSENIGISRISCILIAKKQPYYAIAWDTPLKLSIGYNKRHDLSLKDPLTMQEFWSVTEKVTNPNKSSVSENIGISRISCILIAKKQPYYSIKWDAPPKFSVGP